MSSSVGPQTENFLRAPGSTDSSYTTASRESALLSKPVEHNELFKLNLQERQYSQQYANIYYMRLELLKKTVFASATKSWANMKINGESVQHVSKVLDVRQGPVVWVIGTVYKEMKYKPNILDDVSASHYGAPPAPKEKYIDEETDVILLEDESGRLQLKGDLIKEELLVTGTVIGVLGTEDSTGDFHVMDIILPGYASQEERSKESTGYIALVSGLEINNENEKYQIELLEEYLSGELGGEDDKKLISEISHLILAGNSVTDFVSKENDDNITNYNKAIKFNSGPMYRLDEVLSNLASTLPISIMPGENDPVTSSLPQQPFHKALFKSSRSLIEESIISNVTDPYWWDFNGTKIFGTSGQTINDIYKYHEDNDRINMINHTLLWRHCAPTAPDTLWSYPFRDIDPFLFNETPHIYFVGNQPKFESVYKEGQDENGKPIGIRIISLPKFSQTGQLVLVDLHNLDVKLISISSIAT